MPRKAVGEKLEKVVSTKLSLENFKLLEKYARIRYTNNQIAQPTISHLLRAIVRDWGAHVRKQEKQYNPFITPNSSDKQSSRESSQIN